jgi:L-ascorbate metabolism protein UlaG (beta-lactamase superfamily)
LKVKETRFLDPGGKVSVGKVQIETVPAYNINKFREPGHAFHPLGEKRLGFIITMDGTRIYFSGDTDFIPEMHDIAVDIAMLPVSGTYVMTPEEAAEAALAIHPQIAVPMHYGAIVGADADAIKFKSLVKHCQVEIL